MLEQLKEQVCAANKMLPQYGLKGILWPALTRNKGCKLKVGVKLSCSSLSLLSVCKTILVRRYMATYRQ